MLKYDSDEATKFIAWMNDRRRCSYEEHTILQDAFYKYNPEHKVAAFYLMAKEQFPSIYKRFLAYKSKLRLLGK